MKTIYLTIFLATCVIGQHAFAKHHTTFSYEFSDYKEVEDASTLTLTNKTQTNNFFEAIYTDVSFKNWDIENSALEKNGVSGTLVGFYHFGADNRLFGSTQLQAGSSNLFPKSTIYQEVSYKLGEKQNFLLGAGLGWQDYHNADSDSFYKIGPVYYFDGGAVGYKYGKYKGSKSTLNSLFANYNINDKWSVDAVYNFGEGHWDNIQPFGISHADVDYDELKLKINYTVNPDITIHGSLGKYKMVDKSTNQTSLDADYFGAGLSYLW